MEPLPQAESPPRRERGFALGLTLLVLLCAGWELLAALSRREAAASRESWAAAAAAVRAEFAVGDLIAVAPLWADPLGRAELGDLMPVAMVGRPDGRAYRRIWELSLRGARASDVAGLSPELSRAFGAVELRRYSQTPVAIAYDLPTEIQTLRASQKPAEPATAEPTPCLWQGPLPSSSPQKGQQPGSFRCPQGAVERRTLEIDFQPRYGLGVELLPQQQILLDWAQIPEAAWQGSELRLWFGLHDNNVRRYAHGPVEVTVELDDGALRIPLRVALPGRLQALVVALPKGPARPFHTLRIAATATESRQVLGLLGRLERRP